MENTGGYLPTGADNYSYYYDNYDFHMGSDGDNYKYNIAFLSEQYSIAFPCKCYNVAFLGEQYSIALLPM